MIRFVKVRFRGSIRAERGYFIRVTSDTPVALSGYEVNTEGEEIQPAGFERRLRVISRKAIIHVEELEMDRTYATLVRREVTR